MTISTGETRVELSIVVPMFNEEASLLLLHAAIVEAVAPLGVAYEILFVDDGSTDRTFDVARSLAASDTRLRVIRLRRNFGQTPAMAAGIDHARGKTIVTLDADLQNDPADIPRLLDVLAQGHDMVCGWRERRKDPFFSRRLPSMVANRLIAAVTGVPIRDNGCTLKAFRANLMRSVPLYSEMHRFLPAMAMPEGARIAQLPVRHHPRRFGRSKYGIERMFKVLFDLLTIRAAVSASRPFSRFAKAATAAALPGLLSLVWGFRVAASLPGASVLVPFACASLLFSLACFLLVCGALCELIHSQHAGRVPAVAVSGAIAPAQARPGVAS
jgi:glycosyltransferase involved in cell wall biosynthesis